MKKKLRYLKMILLILFLVALPIGIESVLKYASVEVEMEFCLDRRRPCRGESCKDHICHNKEVRTVTIEKSFKEIIKTYPILLLSTIIYLASIICYIIAVKKNAYTYIGFDDLGKLGIIAICIYIINAIATSIVPMILFKQVGVGPLFSMVSMAFVPFIIRPILVDW